VLPMLNFAIRSSRHHWSGDNTPPLGQPLDTATFMDEGQDGSYPPANSGAYPTPDKNIIHGVKRDVIKGLAYV